MIPAGKLIAVDSETTGLHPFLGDRPFAWSFCNEEGETGYIEWPVCPYTRRVRMRPDSWQALHDFAADETITKVFFNAPFDMRMAEVIDCPMRGKIEDASIGIHVCHSAEPDYKLKSLCKRAGIMDDDDEKALKKLTISCRTKARNKKLGYKLADDVQADYWLPRLMMPEDKTCETYATKDAERTMMLWLLCEETFGPRRRSYEFEMRKLFPCIYRMCGRGLRFDADINRDEIDLWMFRREKARRRLVSLAGWDLNPGSVKQVQRLINQRGLPQRNKTAKGNPSTSSDSLGLIKDDPAIAALLDYREADTAVCDFFEVFARYDAGGVIYANIRQGGKKTGRLSATSPNLQGTADAEGGRGDSEIPARKPFGPRPGFIWLLIDYNQLEVRTFAAASMDEQLIAILKEGRDLHTEATNGIWGGRGNWRALEAAKAVGKDEAWLASFNYDIVKAEASVGKKTSRNKGKPFFFTRMFGGGKRSIAEKLRITENDALELVHSYDATFPGVISFVRRAARMCQRQGYIETLYGRQLDPAWNHKEGQYEWHKSSPYIVQGSAADLVKRAMIVTDDYYVITGLPGGLLLQIHDELIFEVPEDIDPRVVCVLKRICEEQGPPHVRGIIDFPVKVKVVTRYWSEPKDYGW